MGTPTFSKARRNFKPNKSLSWIQCLPGIPPPPTFPVISEPNEPPQPGPSPRVGTASDSQTIAARGAKAEQRYDTTIGRHSSTAKKQLYQHGPFIGMSSSSSSSSPSSSPSTQPTNPKRKRSDDDSNTSKRLGKDGTTSPVTTSSSHNNQVKRKKQKRTTSIDEMCTETTVRTENSDHTTPQQDDSGTRATMVSEQNALCHATHKRAYPSCKGPRRTES